ncbi:hypothetical protein N7475_000421 [Penicillium sp. IBT 31633x]|nr:hypothetical protein N7475_000421 [Penicillium sp. IBT 31633x]
MPSLLISLAGSHRLASLSRQQISAHVSNRASWSVDLASEAQEAGSQPDQALALSLQQLHMVPEAPLKTFAEILTRHLSRYARQQISQRIIPTDEIFQRESRRVLYDSEDAWDQTIADNPQWISAFRKENCPYSLETGLSEDTNETERR